MRYFSTRGPAAPVSFSAALEQGLAPDGGLYVPESFPRASPLESSLAYPEFAANVIAPFVAGDPIESKLLEICQRAFDFPIPLRMRSDDSAVLELFHGPTAAFKDVGARFLAECIAHLPSSGSRTVIVATSGDTGAAVAGAFFGKPQIEVFVLYPKGKISARQEKQIACWGENVRAIAVRGTFDDCQRVVKEALRDGDWAKRRRFVSANSINVARLLAQVTYYARASAEYSKARGKTPNFIVPTGNLGNAFAALWAKKIGFPIGRVTLATNANKTISDFFSSGSYRVHPTVATLANAMDVGDPSNMERLRWLYPDATLLRADVDALSVSNDEISNAIGADAKRSNEVWCPHTATALVAREKLGIRDAIVVATAHPAKFETIVEPLIGKPIVVPRTLESLLSRTPQNQEIEPTLAAFKSIE